MSTQRKIQVTSEPEGADVYYNYDFQGETPVEFDFDWFGYHQFTLQKEGYETLDEKRRIRAPFYLWIPVDFIWEVLPIRMTYREELHFKMEEEDILEIF